MRIVLALAISLSLSACATTSFAPPSVNLENEMAAVGSNYSFGERCMPNQRTGADGRAVPIREDVHGARKLIDNFILMYRCRAHSSANGRQAFELPAFLSLVGATAATAFGAGPDVAIAGGIGNSVFTSGGKYYAAQRKAEIYDHALDALLCIKTEAVGVDGFTLDRISDVEKGAAPRVEPQDGEGPSVTITSSEQYFDMVSAALLSVERVAAQRLSAAGTPFDAAGVIAEIESLKKKTEEKAGEAPKAADQADALLATPQPVAPPAMTELGEKSFTLQSLRFSNAMTALQGTPREQVVETLLYIRLLQPKLQQCVVRAKV